MIARAALVAWLVAAVGCDSIVGAECARGLVLCEGRCLVACTPEIDAGLDGGGIDAEIDASRDAGDAGDLPDAPPIDARRDAELGGGDGGDGGGSFDGGDGGPLDGGPPGCDLGELMCPGGCVDALTDPMNCGDCGNECLSSEVCANGLCQAICDPPLTSCAGLCVDLLVDPDHCGRCGNSCGSGICIDGECSDALAGHVVVIGHDYETSRTGQNRIAGNALFLARGSPVRALVWEGTVTMASRRGVEMAIDQVATAIGRTWMRSTLSDPSRLSLELARSDAFLIHSQPSGSDVALRALGSEWALPLASFLQRGGVIVLFETASAEHAGTFQILEDAGLFTARSRTDSTGAVISVTAPSDAVALRVPLSYAGSRGTVRFDTIETTVVTATSEGPVVIHRTIVP